MSTDDPEIPEADTNIQDLRIDEDLRTSYLSYAMSVIISRALPDARDGLKPSQRRIFLAMNDLNLGARAKEAKCARICGDTSGKYHPHGESVVYPTLVRMQQPFNTRYPMVIGQGNFGNIDGLPPAAMRYTEAKMSPVAEEMLTDLDKETVDTIPNYDETRQEPLVLPAKFPNLVCNGSQGIAVGMATSIPPHNVLEVCEAVILLIDNPEATLQEIMECLPGPDFPTGGTICGRRGIVEGYKSGRSTITLRGKAEVEDKKGRGQCVVVTEIPYMQKKIHLVQKIAQAVKDEKIKGISKVQDHSDRKGIRIVIDVKTGHDGHVVLNQLYQFTPLQDTFSIILLALVNGRPQTLSIRQMLMEFLAHRLEVIRRRTQYLLRRARNRAHVVEGLLIALSSIDEVIHRIRTSQDVPEAREKLMDLEVSAELLNRALGDEGFASFQSIMGVQASYNLTRVQADHILQMQLQRLTALEQDKLLKEYQTLREEITEYERLLSDDANIMVLIREDMVYLRDKYGDARRTEIIEDAGDLAIEDLIADEACIVTISHSGYIKRTPLDTYSTQARGGKGKSGGSTKDGDFLADVFIANTHDYILIFTNRGQCYWLKVHEIPSQSRTSQGRAIVNLLNLKENERISSYVPVREFDDRDLLMVTRKGLVKKTALNAYSRPKQGGIIGISLQEGDDLIAVLLTNSDDQVVLASKHGLAIRFETSQTRTMGRNTMGVRGINLGDDDELVGAVVVPKEGTLLTVCEKGYGKRTAFDEYRIQGRGGKGLINIKATDRNGPVVAVSAVADDDQVMLITNSGMVVRTRVSDVNIIGRNTQGVRVMNVGKGNFITSLAKIVKDHLEDDEDETEENPDNPAAEATGEAEADSANQEVNDELATPEDESSDDSSDDEADPSSNGSPDA